MFKRLFLILAVIGFLLGGGTTGFALEEGDPMPDWETNTELRNFDEWYDPIDGATGVIVYRNDANGQWVYTAAFKLCDEILEKPFGVFDAKGMILYLDHNFDGLIDRIIPNPSVQVHDTDPPCPNPI